MTSNRYTPRRRAELLGWEIIDGGDPAPRTRSRDVWDEIIEEGRRRAAEGGRPPSGG